MSNQGTPPNPPGSTHTLASRGIQPRFGDLVQSCRKLVMNRLAEHLTGVFAQVDDTLFECAEKAENNQVQTLFFDNMREIRRQRPQIERSYHQQIAQNFSDFLEGKLKPPPSTSKLDAEHMALVQNEDYEESLQVTNMVSRVKARCAQSLFALEQRLALLNNGQKLGEDINPFGPQMIAQAFRDALTPCPFPLRIKVILYTLFDTHVMQSLDSIYTALNQRLIDAGVLPNLKYTAQRNNPLLRPKASTAAPAEQAPEGSTTNSHSPTGTPSTPAPGQSYKPVTTDLSGPPPSDPLELLGSLATLLGEHRQRDIDAPLLGGTRSIASFTPREATSTYSASALLDALNRMQQQSANDLSQRLSRPQQVEGLKADLQQQLEAHSELPGQQKVSDQEADVIDLVGMLFDFILDDDNLPDTCKTTLSHLHTPYLKVALQDKALFTQHHHPARRLLNAMAQAGVLYGGEGDERGLLAKMQWVVERVIHDFFGDLQLFNNLLEEFNEFVATLRHKVELRERRAVEAAKGRDKLLGARQHAVEVIGNSLNNRQPPTIIRNFLELTWADVLVFVLLRNGEQSPEWQRACEAAEQLAWSGTLLDDAGRERLQKLRVPLLEDLRKGLELLGGYHEDGIRRLLQDLVACQHAVQAKQPQVAAQLKPILPESPLGAMLGEDAALATLAPRESTLSTRALALAKELGHIEFGTWFEFVNGEQVRTLKLSWFSPTTRNYMFVDQSGQRVAIKPLTQLATEMEQGLARIVTPERGAPLVDRALTAIYRVLQRFTGRTAEPQE
ncbi:MAG: DUF1631 domain-containing protein [Pseudomonas sp.]|uniref:DUF1631 domain-containing protein n=1 Tax=Pseudomonas sp. FEMGT703P TaxID=2080764 RepID=UPI000CB100E0|nr:DUF1631 domain-containing protein [Pseudomonas sp. FEMGT703P]PJE42786.1 MAG: DUF1631 domain-containing protein [Pseudomonas sp.] [Pseudomonas sp. FEMGT703P]